MTSTRRILFLIMITIMLLPASAIAQVSEPTVPDGGTAWLEPRGVNIVDMVGNVPESDLAGAIISYETGTGMLIYESGARSGNSSNTVTVNVSIVPRYFNYGANSYTQFGCLSQVAAWDQWPSTSPATTVKVFTGSQDITRQIINLGTVPAGQILPTGNAGDYQRYPPGPVNNVAAANPFPLPANNGCTIVLNGRYTNLTATFQATAPRQINVTPHGSQTFSVHSYIGPGNAGELASLNKQMGKFGNRHDKFDMSAPTDADYVIVKFGPTAIDPYIPASDTANVGLAGSGSYRFDGGGLTVDFVSSIGVPLKGNWQDADQSGGGEFLPYLSGPFNFTSPEYFLPPGFPFNQCMVDGGCPDALLNDLYNFTYPVTLYYYRFDRLPGSTLQRIPLKAVGKGYSTVATTQMSGQNPEQLQDFSPAQIPAPTPTGGSKVFLPAVYSASPPAPPPTDDPTGCPCGWFDAQGRMFDFIPRP